MPTLNRIGGRTQEHRPLTPYERGQMLTHYPTVGPIEMATRLHRTVDSVKYHWRMMKLQRNLRVGDLVSFGADPKVYVTERVDHAGATFVPA